jgi:DNA repair exonuclease SbcCD ATPase subunit
MFTISDFAKMQNKCNLNVIWFDEIFSELDPHSCESILDIIKEYPAKSKFIITHKDLFKDEFKNRIYVEKNGKSSSVRVNYLTGETT